MKPNSLFASLLGVFLLAACSGEIGAMEPVDLVPPKVVLVAPFDGALFSSARAISIEATASDDTGVARVEFYDRTHLIGTASAAPYGMSWGVAEADNGVHVLTARAFDRAGNISVSTPNTVTVAIVATVADALPPTVAITSPVSGQSYTTSQTVNITAAASDNVGVTKVEFYDQAVLIGTSLVSPYNYVWVVGSSLNGTHSFTAKAFDAANNSAVSVPITLTVNVPGSDTSAPTVTITAPQVGQTYTQAQAVALTATATDNVAVVRVEFFDGTTLVGADTAAPFAATWNVTLQSNGSHTLTAKAFDAAGNSTTSAPRLAQVNIASLGNAILTWNAPTTNSDNTPLVDLAGYKVYSRLSTGTYGAPATVAVMTSPTYTVGNLAAGKTYFFTVTAFDTSGNESAQVMPEVSKAIP